MSKMARLEKENREIGERMEQLENETMESYQEEAWKLMTEIQMLDTSDVEQYKKGLRLMLLGRLLGCDEYREIGRDFYESHCRLVSHKWFDAMSFK